MTDLEFVDDMQGH